MFTGTPTSSGLNAQHSKFVTVKLSAFTCPQSAFGSQLKPKPIATALVTCKGQEKENHVCVERIPLSISYAFSAVSTKENSHLKNIFAVYLCKDSGCTSQRTLCFHCWVRSTSLRVEI